VGKTYPSEKYESVGITIPNIWTVIKFMFQTNNQLIIGQYPSMFKNIGSREQLAEVLMEIISKAFYGNIREMQLCMVVTICYHHSSTIAHHIPRFECLNPRFGIKKKVSQPRFPKLKLLCLSLRAPPRR